LVCWNCGKSKDVIVNAIPQFAFELANIANSNGMYGAFDFNHMRVLVFCNQKCANMQKTKQGYFRLRPKKINKE
jgi:hypothetical protein